MIGTERLQIKRKDKAAQESMEISARRRGQKLTRQIGPLRQKRNVVGVIKPTMHL